MKGAIALLALIAAALLLGPAGLDPAAMALRAPRIAAAIVMGAGLALSGVAMQALLRNPLAEPYVLGLSGGASLGAVGAALLWPGVVPAIPASLGALAAALLVAGLGRGADGLLPPTRLLLAGVAVGSVLGGLVSFALSVAPRARVAAAALYWMSGGLAATRPWSLAVAAVAVGISAAILVSRRADLDRLLLGEETAASLGVDVRRTRAILLGVSAALTGALVALGGPVGFVGLAAPHLARLLGRATHGALLPRAAWIGAALLLVADTAARAAFSPREIPTGALTAALGGPFFLWLLRSRRYAFGEAC